MALGAGGIAMGSRFIASIDSEFYENYKNVVPPTKAQDTLVTMGTFGTIRLWRNKFSSYFANRIVQSKEEKMAQEKAYQDHQASLSKEEFAEELRKKTDADFAAYRGDMENGAVLLGQSIGIVNQIRSASEIIENIIKDAEKALKKVITFLE